MVFGYPGRFWTARRVGDADDPVIPGSGLDL